ncbi:helix-turn-helix transcriptional regulator [uncultured Psychroserpens sp.]|uniref:helix-turn-helix domain-containing protein n=1 Tax=uncultured Psychroserpens sp. TaxID=255436 RepID=UPI0026139CE7|nr:helix-turn-helix transcriptional regulator [uncultured Psychroserpens sp.]
MPSKIGSLHDYPYIGLRAYKTEAFTIETRVASVLIWNINCSISCCINDLDMVIPANTVVLLDEGCTFSCQSNAISKLKLIEFNTDIFSQSILLSCGYINKLTRKDFRNHTLLFLENRETRLIETMFSLVEREITNPCIDIDKLKTSMCSTLKTSLLEKFEDDDNYINYFGELLGAQFNIFHNVSDYASQLDIEPKTLLRLFQKNKLKNPSDIIKEKLLLESKKLIVYTNKSIREICFEVGFYDPAYFSRFFKKHLGVTAKKFRQQYAKC